MWYTMYRKQNTDNNRNDRTTETHTPHTIAGSEADQKQSTGGAQRNSGNSPIIKGVNNGVEYHAIRERQKIPS